MNIAPCATYLNTQVYSLPPHPQRLIRPIRRFKSTKPVVCTVSSYRNGTLRQHARHAVTYYSFETYSSLLGSSSNLCHNAYQKLNRLARRPFYFLRLSVRGGSPIWVTTGLTVVIRKTISWVIFPISIPDPSKKSQVQHPWDCSLTTTHWTHCFLCSHYRSPCHPPPSSSMAPVTPFNDDRLCYISFTALLGYILPSELYLAEPQLVGHVPSRGGIF